MFVRGWFLACAEEILDIPPASMMQRIGDKDVPLVPLIEPPFVSAQDLIINSKWAIPILRNHPYTVPSTFHLCSMLAKLNEFLDMLLFPVAEQQDETQKHLEHMELVSAIANVASILKALVQKARHLRRRSEKARNLVLKEIKSLVLFYKGEDIPEQAYALNDGWQAESDNIYTITNGDSDGEEFDTQLDTQMDPVEHDDGGLEDEQEEEGEEEEEKARDLEEPEEGENFATLVDIPGGLGGPMGIDRPVAIAVDFAAEGLEEEDAAMDATEPEWLSDGDMDAAIDDALLFLENGKDMDARAGDMSLRVADNLVRQSRRPLPDQPDFVSGTLAGIGAGSMGAVAATDQTQLIADKRAKSKCAKADALSKWPIIDANRSIPDSLDKDVADIYLRLPDIAVAQANKNGLVKTGKHNYTLSDGSTPATKIQVHVKSMAYYVPKLCVTSWSESPTVSWLQHGGPVQAWDVAVTRAGGWGVV